MSDTLKHTRYLKKRKPPFSCWRTYIHIPSLLKLDHPGDGLGEEKHAGQLPSGYKAATQHTKMHRCELRYNCNLHRLSHTTDLAMAPSLWLAASCTAKIKAKQEARRYWYNGIIPKHMLPVTLEILGIVSLCLLDESCLKATVRTLLHLVPYQTYPKDTLSVKRRLWFLDGRGNYLWKVSSFFCLKFPTESQN